MPEMAITGTFGEDQKVGSFKYSGSCESVR